MSGEIDPKQFRQALGQYPTGVVVVTALDAGGEALGMTVGSFTSVSLDPPLVAFLPVKSSSSWQALRESGDRFCVNMLGSHQENVCRAIATRKSDKFSDIGWHPSAAGNPVIDGAVAYVDCTVEVIHDAGDHHIVVGRVDDLEVLASAYPLLFFRGGYGSFRPLSLTAGDADLLDQLKLVDLARPHMEDLAHHFDSEVTAICLVRDELVLAAAAGRAKSAVAPTRVGRRVSFTPPLGGVYAAWGSDELRESWISRLDESASTEVADHMRQVPDLVRDRGFAISMGHELSAQLEMVSSQLSEGHPEASLARLSELIGTVSNGYNPTSLDDDDRFELRSVTAPVFNAARDVAFTLTLWGPPGDVTRASVSEHTERLLQAAAAATSAIGGVRPS